MDKRYYKNKFPTTYSTDPEHEAMLEVICKMSGETKSECIRRLIGAAYLREVGANG